MRTLGKLGWTIIVFEILTAGCKHKIDESPQIAPGISQENARKLIEVARATAAEWGVNVKNLDHSVTILEENTLYVPYHTPATLEKLHEALKKEKPIFEVTFRPKPLNGGGAIWGGGLSVYLNPAGQVIAVERDV